MLAKTVSLQLTTSFLLFYFLVFVYVCAMVITSVKSEMSFY